MRTCRQVKNTAGKRLSQQGKAKSKKKTRAQRQKSRKITQTHWAGRKEAVGKQTKWEKLENREDLRPETKN